MPHAKAPILKSNVEFKVIIEIVAIYNASINSKLGLYLNEMSDASSFTVWFLFIQFVEICNYLLEWWLFFNSSFRCKLLINCGEYFGFDDNSSVDILLEYVLYWEDLSPMNFLKFIPYNFLFDQ